MGDSGDHEGEALSGGHLGAVLAEIDEAEGGVRHIHAVEEAVVRSHVVQLFHLNYTCHSLSIKDTWRNMELPKPKSDPQEIANYI